MSAFAAVPSGRALRTGAKRIVVAYGFWIFLLSDIVMFSALFATYAVLVQPLAVRPGLSCSIRPILRSRLAAYCYQASPAD